mgnify:CR=1 FL=1
MSVSELPLIACPHCGQLVEWAPDILRLMAYLVPHGLPDDDGPETRRS